MDVNYFGWMIGCRLLQHVSTKVRLTCNALLRLVSPCPGSEDSRHVVRKDDFKSGACLLVEVAGALAAAVVLGEDVGVEMVQGAVRLLAAGMLARVDALHLVELAPRALLHALPDVGRVDVPQHLREGRQLGVEGALRRQGRELQAGEKWARIFHALPGWPEGFK